MCQISLPDGLELVAFSWDQLPPSLTRGVAWALSGPLAQGRVRPTAHPVERLYGATPGVFDEDVERWDGLS